MKFTFLVFVLVFSFTFSVYAQQGVVGTSRFTNLDSGKVEAIIQYFSSASTARTMWDNLGVKDIYTTPPALAAARQTLLQITSFGSASTEGKTTNQAILISRSGPLDSIVYYILIIDGEPVAIGRS